MSSNNSFKDKVNQQTINKSFKKKQDLALKHKSTYTCTHMQTHTHTLTHSVRQWSGVPGFNPRSCHTKDFKNGT